MIRERPDIRITRLPVVVLSPHNRCNCRCLMCDIWKIGQTQEITEQDLESHISSLRILGVQWIVFSGGEPLMHGDLRSLCNLLRPEGIRLTVLTAGISMEKDALLITDCFDEAIVSLDGPPDIHDSVRGINGAYRQLKRGIEAVRTLKPQLQIHGRCVVQKQNFQKLRSVVSTAQDLKLDTLSFLAADLTSIAFNRPVAWSSGRLSQIGLTAAEVDSLEKEIQQLISEFGPEIESGFIRESPDKLLRIVLRFRAHLGQVENTAPLCNAPWVSTVVEADGTVRPCFFHEALGNLRDQPLVNILNGDKALNFRQRLDVRSNPVCKACVCSLFLPEGQLR